MASKNLSDSAKKLLAMRKAQAVSAPKKNAPAKSAIAKPAEKAKSQAKPKAKPEAKARMNESSVAALSGEDEVKQAVKKDVDNFVAGKKKAKVSPPKKGVDVPPDFDLQRIKGAEFQDSLKGLERDLPKGGRAVKVAEELAAGPAEHEIMNRIRSQGTKKSLGKVGKLVGAGMLGGAVGIGLDALMEGTLGADDAGDADADAMQAAEAKQGAKTKAMLARRGKPTAPLPTQTIREGQIIPGKAPKAPKHAAMSQAKRDAQQRARGFNNEGDRIGGEGVEVGNASDTQALHQPAAKSDSSLQGDFERVLMKNFKENFNNGGVHVPSEEGSDDDDLTKLVTETDLRQMGDTPGPMKRPGGPKNSPAKRPVVLKTRPISEEDDEY